jgi:hypothetical protein
MRSVELHLSTSDSLLPTHKDVVIPTGTAMEKSRHCCEDMTGAVTSACAEHPDRTACPDALVDYASRFDEYGLIIHDGGTSTLAIRFCPFCGTSLPSSKRDQWFAALEARGIAGRRFAAGRVQDRSMVARRGITRHCRQAGRSLRSLSHPQLNASIVGQLTDIPETPATFPRKRRASPGRSAGAGRPSPPCGHRRRYLSHGRAESPPSEGP